MILLKPDSPDLEDGILFTCPFVETQIYFLTTLYTTTDNATCNISSCWFITFGNLNFICKKIVNLTHKLLLFIFPEKLLGIRHFVLKLDLFPFIVYDHLFRFDQFKSFVYIWYLLRKSRIFGRFLQVKGRKRLFEVNHSHLPGRWSIYSSTAGRK